MPAKENLIKTADVQVTARELDFVKNQIRAQLAASAGHSGDYAPH